jgi:hypothetical protein
LRLLHGEPGGGVGGGSSDAWSAAGAALRVATRASGAVPMSALVAAAAQRRRDIGTTALAEATLDPCPLAGLAHAEYFGGSAGAVLFRGATSRVTAVGTAVSAVNCDLAQCAPRYDGTRAFAPGRVGRLKVAAGLDWELGAAPALVTRTVTLPAGAATLSFVDGETGARVTLPLPGCRAEATGGGNGGGGGGGAALLEVRGRARAGARRRRGGGRRGAAALPDGCFVVRCSTSATQHLFCAPPPAPGGLPAAEVARSWVADVNAASHGLTAPSRYEVLSRTALAPRAVGNMRRPRERGYLETAIYREAWALSFLSTLVSAGATPHLPLLLDVFRCSSLPAVLVARPRSEDGVSGALPPSMPGAAALGAGGAVVAAAAPGGAAQWGSLWTDTAQGDLGRALAAFAPGALAGAWLRGLLFQLVWTLAVGRHAFGLRHGGLLALSAVKLQQLPRRSPAARKFVCYRTTPEVLAGVSLRVPARAPGAPPVSARSAAGAPDALWEVDDARADADACYRADVASRVAAGAAAAAAAGAPPAAADRASWCVRADDVDGLRVKLHDFERAVLVRKQLEWWADGYSFPNTPWRDDLADLAASLCPLAAAAVAGWADFARGAAADLCARMAAGEFASNPGAALRHALFDGLPAVADVPAPDRALFSYVPVTVDRIPPRGGSNASAGDGAAAGAGGGAGGGGGDAGLADADAADARAAALDGLYPDDVSRRVMLGMLTPPRPWVVRRGPLAATVAWSAHLLPAWLARQAPQPRATTYNVYVNGVSVHSGPGRRAALALLTPELQFGCVRVAVSAFYATLGWTERSEPLQLNECPIDDGAHAALGEGELEPARAKGGV